MLFELEKQIDISIIDSKKPSTGIANVQFIDGIAIETRYNDNEVGHVMINNFIRFRTDLNV